MVTATPLRSAAGFLLLIAFTAATGNVRAVDLQDHLTSTARNGNSQQVVALLDQGADINARDGSGYTPLQAAVGWGNVEMVRLLIDSGANIDVCDNLEATPPDQRPGPVRFYPPCDCQKKQACIHRPLSESPGCQVISRWS